ncbi:MAG: IPT/TIG domain-containing protein [Myxococcales bacterium]
MVKRNLIGCGLIVALAVPSSALGQIANPSYANLYWEAAGQDWDTDIAAYAATQEDAGSAAYLYIASMTRDGLDSMAHAMLSSAWVTDWQPYGIMAVDATPYDFQIIPEDNSTVPACQNVTPSTSNVADWLNNLSLFVGCAVALYPGDLNANVVMNVFIPPWVVGSEPWQGFNEAVDGGISASFLPASFEPYGLPQMAYIMSHEDTEATAGGNNGPNAYRQIADVCEGANGQSITFLPTIINSGSLTDYEQYQDGVFTEWFDAGVDAGNQTQVGCFLADGGAEVPCVCVPPQSSIPAMGVPSVQACGSGQNVILQMQLDQSASRNPTPWDIANGETLDGGSLYFSTLIRATPSWWAGGEHAVGLPNPVTMNALYWSSGGYLEMDGFATGYGGTNVAIPGAQIDLYAFDPVWGQLNSSPSGSAIAPFVTAEMPYAFYDVQAAHPIGSQYQAWNVQGALQGNPACGLPGHTVGPAAIGDATVTIQGASGDSYPPSVISAATGFFDFDYTPATPGTKTVTMTAPGGLQANKTIVVAPEVDTITPSAGVIAGGQSATIVGKGLGGALQIELTYERANGTIGGATPIPATGNGTSVTFTIPPSPLPPPGAGAVAVAVYSNSAGLTSANSLAFTYVQAGVPYITFNPGYHANCAPDDHAYVSALLFNADGGYDPYAQITFAETPPSVVSFSPATIGNGGLSLASITVAPGNSYDFTATSGSYVADAVVPVYEMADCKPVAYLNPFAINGHQVEGEYSFNGTIWVPPVLGDPWDWAEPVVTHIASSYPPSSFTLKSLGLDWIWGLNSFKSTSGNSLAAIPYTAHPSGNNLCSTGRVLSITNTNETPSWNATALYPIDASIPAADYRVFGLDDSNAVWVEMITSVVNFGSGQAIEASDETVDPHRVISGAINGPYALAYWSSSPCPKTGP